MKWMIIILIMMSLLGSIMWAMPTPRQKYQAKLRAKAKSLGYQIHLQRLSAPRAKGEIEPETKDMIAYRLLRKGLSLKQKNAFKEWQVFRVESLVNQGLSFGWSWGKGENTLDQKQLTELNGVLEKLPEGIFSVASTAAHISAYWDEEGGEELLLQLQTLLSQFLKKDL